MRFRFLFVFACLFAFSLNLYQSVVSDIIDDGGNDVTDNIVVGDSNDAFASDITNVSIC